MKNIRNAVIGAAIIGATALATLSPANAWWRWGPGPFWGGGPAGAVAGAVVGSAVAAAPYYPPYSYYGPRPCGTATPGYAAATKARAARQRALRLPGHGTDGLHNQIVICFQTRALP